MQPSMPIGLLPSVADGSKPETGPLIRKLLSETKN